MERRGLNMSECAVINQNNTAILPTVETLAMQINEIIAGLAFCEKRVSADDVFKNRMGRLADDVTAVASEIELLLNSERNEQDSLISILESRDVCILELNAKVRGLKGQIETLTHQRAETIQEAQDLVSTEREKAQEAICKVERTLGKAIGELEVSKSNCVSLMAYNTSLRIDVKALKALEPVKTQKKLAEQKKKNIELTRTKNELQNSLNQTQLLNISLKKSLSEMEAQYSVLVSDMDIANARMNMLDGDHCLRGLSFISDKNRELIFYPHIFHFGLHVTESVEREHGERFISGLDFHVQVRTTWGVDTTVKMNEWGAIIYYLVAELKEHWPVEMDDFLQEFHHDQLEVLNPLLHKRCVWAGGFSVMDIESLPVKIRESLWDAGYHTLAKLGSASLRSYCKVKGIGEKLAEQIKTATTDLLMKWNAEHGTPNLREHGEKRENPATRIRKAQQENRKKK
ncbi:helix-hairpin-helix domain-containing protein [Yersinia ruckeri]|uniref:helix-hairpin-helix domain-containing protein n=1 Tax=Yersinia ruckeri TaxID=29486 RepID=UPI0020C11C58|nr:helix-hairpin-helix domain-containing protein [Yersinia ruckeri]MCK8586364.1 helix-hairpin-helix domain-containing protein [Yersinia ruckeri]